MKKIYQKLKDIFILIFYFIFPNKCYFCENTTKEYICNDCKLMYKNVFKTNHITKFKDSKDITYISNYEGISKKMIEDMKYRKIDYIPDIFLSFVKDDKEFKKYIMKNNYITYIPTTKKTIKKRTYNQAKLIAEKLSEIYNIPIISLCNKTEKNNTKQKFLNREERYLNISGTIVLKEEERGRKLKGNLLIVDDVYTTGATCYEVKRIIEEQHEDIKLKFCTLAYTKFS